LILKLWFFIIIINYKITKNKRIVMGIPTGDSGSKRAGVGEDYSKDRG
jgi:hypothetical protein